MRPDVDGLLLHGVSPTNIIKVCPMQARVCGGTYRLQAALQAVVTRGLEEKQLRAVIQAAARHVRSHSLPVRVLAGGLRRRRARCLAIAT